MVQPETSLMTVRYGASTATRRENVTFSQQKWLRARAPALFYTYVCLVRF
jgi:hypothetical protein